MVLFKGGERRCIKRLEELDKIEELGKFEELDKIA